MVLRTIKQGREVGENISEIYRNIACIIVGRLI